GQENDDLRLTWLLAQTIDACSERRTDGGSVFDAADLNAVEVLLKPVGIEWERTDEIRRASEPDQPGAVVRSGVDEFRDDRFHHIQAFDRFSIDLEIERFHRAGAVHGEDHVNAASVDGGSAA